MMSRKKCISKLFYSNTSISVFKAVLAYVLFFVIFSLKNFQKKFYYPEAATSALLFCIGALPGKPSSTCLQFSLLGIVGIGIGSLTFFLVQVFNEIPVVQAVILFLTTYFMGILKSIHDNIFFMSLVVVLMTWSGIYVSFITDVKTKFPVEHLKSIVLAYLCGAVITLVVNLLIFPRSAEKELRTTLVKSLESLKSIVQIFENIYIFQISEDQIKKLHGLTQSIRNDSNELQAQFDQTFIDISFSRRSFSEYEEIVKQTRNLQRWILLGFSTLEGLQDSNFQCSKKSMFYELGVELEEMKRMIIFGITAVQEELGYKSPSLPNQNFPRVDTNEFMQNLTMIDQNRTGELVFSVKDEENTETCCAEEPQEFQSAKIQSYSNVSFNNSSSSINFDETSTSQEKSYQFTRKSFTIVDFKSGQLQKSLIGMKKISQSFESRNLEMQNKVLLSIVTPAYSCYTSKQSNITREIKFTQLKKTQKLNNEDFDSIKFCAKNTFDASCDSTVKDKITGGETKESQRDPESEVEEDCSAKGSEIESQVFLMKCQALTLSLSEFSKSLFLLWDSTEQNKFDGQRRKTSKFCIYISSRISTIDLLKRILRSKKSTKSKDYKFCKNKDREESSQHHTNLLNKTKNNFPRILNIKYQIVSLRVFLMSPQSVERNNESRDHLEHIGQ
ncbi:hypothetical protein BY996DRAFT_4098566 [Phakopsora pachyrhizi]|nr:hypothetical protein BY996DRAFT_4098566 [Phakopsora pachyrhizi]